MDLITTILHSLKLSLPLLVLIATGLTLLVADVLLARAQRWMLSLMSVIGLGLAFVALHAVGGSNAAGEGTIFFGALGLDRLSFLAQNVILAGGLFLVAISPRWLSGRLIPHGEYYALLIFSVMSMMALAASTELLTLFLNLEMLSIALYVLAGMEKNNLKSTEAAFKYFLLGSVAGAFLLMGIAFIFGGTGELRYEAIASVMAEGRVLNSAFLVIGLGLALVGFAFKLTLAPFHMYAPDVYDGAPTPVAAALATGLKVATLAALFHFVELMASCPGLPRGLWAALYIIALASMLVGNLGAIVQPRLKRMLAYSSISHSGYAVVPMVVVLAHPELMDAAREAVAYYMLAYTAMTLLVFGIAATLGKEGEGEISAYAGLGQRAPVLAALMTLGLISLLGMPPTVGFFGKLQLFKVAVDGGHIVLAVLGVLSSVASAFYYLRVTITMYMTPAPEGAKPVCGVDCINYAALAVGGVCLFLFALLPGLYFCLG